jgi:hypothetical protein
MAAGPASVLEFFLVYVTSRTIGQILAESRGRKLRRSRLWDVVLAFWWVLFVNLPR